LSFDHPGDAALARKMIQQSRRTILVVTGAKFHRYARITAVPVTVVHGIIADAIDAKVKEALARHGIDVVEVPVSHSADRGSVARLAGQERGGG
jgi:DeoR/GlpR family transcriptional regulator of sugar metabolism